jgi:hypothetical protein
MDCDGSSRSVTLEYQDHHWGHARAAAPGEPSSSELEHSAMAGKPTRQYLDTPVKVKYPVGKVAGVDAHTYSGSSVMHRLVERIDGNGKKTWWLACQPRKKAIYSYMGYKSTIACQKCKRRDIDTDTESVISSIDDLLDVPEERLP